MGNSRAAFDRYLDERFPTEESKAELNARVLAVNVAADLVLAIDEIRRRRGLSKAAVAGSMGKDPAAISRLMNDPSPNPTLATVVELLDALDIYLAVDVHPQPAKERHPTIEIRTVDRELKPASC